MNDDMAEKSNPFLGRILKTLSRHYGAQVLPFTMTPLDALLFALVAEHAPWYRARAFFAKAREKFVDWNEMRTAFGYEIDVLLSECKVPEPRRVSQRLRAVLGALIARNNFLSLDHFLALKQTEAKQPLEQLTSIAGELAVTSMKQYALEWIAFAPYADIVRPLKRLEAVRVKATERQVGMELYKGLPREDVNACCALLAELGGRLCTEKKPACARCPLLRACPGAKRIKEEAKAKAQARKSAKKKKTPAKPAKKTAKKKAPAGKPSPRKKTTASNARRKGGSAGKSASSSRSSGTTKSTAKSGAGAQSKKSARK